MEPALALKIAAILFFGSVLQSVVGFAFGMFAVTLLVWIELPLPEALAICGSATFVQSLWSVYRLREHIPPRETVIACGLRFIALPFGVLCLGVISTFGAAEVKRIVGCFILAALITQHCCKVEPKEKVHWIWTVLAFCTSGFFVGTIGMGGPPQVLWVMAHRWSNLKTRAFLFATGATIVPVHLTAMWFRFGESILTSAITGLTFTPLILAGTTVGLKVGATLSKPLLRKIAYGLLCVISLSAILST